MSLRGFHPKNLSTIRPSAAQNHLSKRLTCCLVSEDGASKGCSIKENSWDLFLKLRKLQRQEDTSFLGCEAAFKRTLYQWEPQEVVTFCSSLSKSGSPHCEEILRTALFRGERLILSLSPQALLEFLEVCSAHGVREHDPKRPDLFAVAGPKIADCVAAFSAAEIGRISTIYRQQNIGDQAVLEALGSQLLALFEQIPGFSSTAKALPAEQPEPAGGLETVHRQPRNADLSPLISASMSYLSACGRLNIFTPQVQPIFDLIAPLMRKKRDFGRLTSLAQLSAKFGLADELEARRVLLAVCECFEAEQSLLSPSSVSSSSSSTSSSSTSSVSSSSSSSSSLGSSTSSAASSSSPVQQGHASQVVYGQLLLALISDPAPDATRDRALLMCIKAVRRLFSDNIIAMDERLARQLQVAQLACELERPEALKLLEDDGLLSFLDEVKELNHEVAPLPKNSSQQHWQVSSGLRELGIRHRLEENILPYVADIRILKEEKRLIEIDGPLHFVGRTSRYDMKSRLKHRLLTKQGWLVHHIAWFDWPVHHHSRLNYLARLLQSPPPGPDELQEYRSYQDLALPSSSSSSESASGYKGEGEGEREDEYEGKKQEGGNGKSPRPESKYPALEALRGMDLGVSFDQHGPK